MDNEPIPNEITYQEILVEIERLFDAEPGTPEGDRLEFLVGLVEAYEREHYPMDRVA
jgi:HTH-type transcriptional regulator / antitoxin HigA